MIKEAYSDANKLVNHEAIKDKIDFNTAAALEFLGPAVLNKDQQAQIQSVFANMATMHESASPYTPN
ncbi:hypothetical protein NX059_006192 [Plenodomus lindquistii]|nr:hypothetical protein NX059_006192 [Plenodomus lindquistii]